MKNLTVLTAFLIFLTLITSLEMIKLVTTPTLLDFIAIGFFVIISLLLFEIGFKKTPLLEIIYLLLFILIIGYFFVVRHVPAAFQHAIIFSVAPIIAFSITRLGLALFTNALLLFTTLFYQQFIFEHNINALQITSTLLAVSILSLFGTSYRKTLLLNDRISTLLYTDSLTTLYNRTKYTELLQQFLKKKHPFFIVALNINHFKSINRMYGEETGNNILIELSKRLQTLPPPNYLFRFNGDEFHLIYPQQEYVHCQQITNRINQVLSAPYYVDTYPIHLSVSIIVVPVQEQIDSVSSLLKCIQVTMLAAKNNHTDTVLFFEKKIEEVIKRNQQIMTDKEYALQEKQFSLVYQPIIRFQSQQVYSVEALIRWNHPTLGLISPLEFIPSFEESRFIIPLGKWILEEACTQVKKWHDQGLLIRLSVNISPIQFTSISLLEDLKDVLTRTQFPPHYLTLEITEQSLIIDLQQVISVIAQLRKMGIKVALDDFGTGYSSLNILQQLPVHELKIAREFLLNNNEEQFLTFMNSICTIANFLKMNTVMEGVETPQQINLLKHTNVTFLQGYHFSKPLSSTDMTTFLLSKKEGMANAFGNEGC